MRTWVMNYSLANLFTDWSLFYKIITGWPLTRHCIPVFITITTRIYWYSQLLANTSTNAGCLGQSGRSFHSTKATSDRGFSFYNAQSIQNKSLVIISSIIIIFITEPFHLSFFLETWTNNGQQCILLHALYCKLPSKSVPTSVESLGSPILSVLVSIWNLLVANGLLLLYKIFLPLKWYF